MQKIKENEDKTAKEIELYHEIKRYIALLNEEATIEQAKLYIISSAFECLLDEFVIIAYAAKRWKNILVDGLAKYIEEKYQEKLERWTMPCEYTVSEVIPGMLYAYRYYIQSRHMKSLALQMYYHGAEEKY